MNSQEECPFLSRVIFRTVQPTDISRCYSIETASYPPDEAASKSNLQYRQHHAASYFRCAFLIDEPPPPGEVGESRGMKGMASVTGCIIGYICSTRCEEFTEKSMKEHDPNGKYLAIHSVAVHEKYRKKGVGSAMLKDYWQAMERLNTGVSQGGGKNTLEKIVLMAKKQMLPFYARNGFSVTRLSDIVHGQDEWFELERKFPIQTGRKCYLVDAFVDPSVKEGRSGNPAGVILLDGPPGLGVDDEEKKQKMRFAASCESLDEIIKIDEDDKQDTIPAQCHEWMSAVAKELNQSETAFVWPIEYLMVQQLEFQHIANTVTALQKQPVPSSTCPSTYAIRYYTRTGVEVDLCGHATLASASVLLNSKQGDEHTTNSITFYAKKDVLCAKLKVCCPPDTRPRIAMDFPWKNVTPVESGSGRDVVLDMISRAFFGARATAANSVVNPVDTSVGAKFRQFFNPKDPDLFHHITLIGTTDGEEDLFVELTEEGFDLLRGIDVDHSALCSWSGYSRGVIICCTCETTSADTPDFRSRFFGPKAGINEDAVTGSAHCSLGPYFGNKLNKTVVVGQQESDRGGLVECTLKAEDRRVEIVGTAVKTMSGIMTIDL